MHVFSSVCFPPCVYVPRWCFRWLVSPPPRVFRKCAKHVPAEAPGGPIDYCGLSSPRLRLTCMFCFTKNAPTKIQLCEKCGDYHTTHNFTRESAACVRVGQRFDGLDQVTVLPQPPNAYLHHAAVVAPPRCAASTSSSSTPAPQPRAQLRASGVPPPASSPASPRPHAAPSGGGPSPVVSPDGRVSRIVPGTRCALSGGYALASLAIHSARDFDEHDDDQDDHGRHKYDHDDHDGAVKFPEPSMRLPRPPSMARTTTFERYAAVLAHHHHAATVIGSPVVKPQLRHQHQHQNLHQQQQQQQHGNTAPGVGAGSDAQPPKLGSRPTSVNSLLDASDAASILLEFAMNPSRTAAPRAPAVSAAAASSSDAPPSPSPSPSPSPLRPCGEWSPRFASPAKRTFVAHPVGPSPVRRLVPSLTPSLGQPASSASAAPHGTLGKALVLATPTAATTFMTPAPEPSDCAGGRRSDRGNSSDRGSSSDRGNSSSRGSDNDAVYPDFVAHAAKRARLGAITA